MEHKLLKNINTYTTDLKNKNGWFTNNFNEYFATIFLP